MSETRDQMAARLNQIGDSLSLSSDLRFRDDWPLDVAALRAGAAALAPPPAEAAPEPTPAGRETGPRDAILDDAMRAVLSVRDTCEDDDDRELVQTVTGAACYRIWQLKAKP